MDRVDGEVDSHWCGQE